MALSEQLPIFRDSYDLLGRTLDLQSKMPRSIRYSIGQRMVDLSLDIMSQIYEANTSLDKVSALTTLLNKYGMLTMLYRMTFEKKVITTRQYAPYVELLAKIGKQATAWRQHYSA